MLNFRKIKKDFAPQTLREGEQLLSKGGVKEAKIVSLSTSTVRLHGLVIGNFDHLYSLEVDIDRTDSSLNDSNCSCPQCFDCSHLAAFALYLEKNFESLVVTFSKGKDEDKVEEELQHTFKEAERIEGVKKSKRHQKELLESYIHAASVLAQSPFFASEEAASQELAEISVLFNLADVQAAKGVAPVEFQVGLKLPFRSKPLLVTQVKEFLDAVRYQEPIWIQHKRYFLPTGSFDFDSSRILQSLLSHARFHEVKGDKVGRVATLEREVFATLLSEAWEFAIAKEVAPGEEEYPPLPCLFNNSFDEPLRFATHHAEIRFDLKLISEPISAIILQPQVVLEKKEGFPLDQLTLLECSKPGILKEGVYYRYTHKIKRKHLRSLRPIQHMSIPEPLIGTFIENSVPELLRFAQVSNQEALENFVTLPFAGEIGGMCEIHYLDGELEATIDFVYDGIKVPYATSQLKLEQFTPFVSEEGILARNLVEEQKIIDDLFQDFVYDPETALFKVKNDKKIVEFMTETIPRYQSRILFNCPENLLDQFVYDDTTFKISLKEGSRIDCYEVDLEVKGPLKGTTLDQLWDCISSKRSFIELPNSKRTKKDRIGKYLVLNLDRLSPVVQIFDEIGIGVIDTHKEERPLWSLVTLNQELFEGLPIQYKMSDRLHEIQQQMLGMKEVKTTPIPSIIKAVPHCYQVEGVAWLERLRGMHLNGILADDMGLGKTLQAIIALSQFHDDYKKTKSIVVCPTSLVYNWKEEVARFNPNLRVLAVDGNPVQRRKLLEELDNFDLIVTSYTLMQKDIEVYEKIPFGYAILDEAQHIKNRATRNAKSVKSINAKHRLILTGTPVENSLDELWSLFDFLMPGLLSSYDRFLEKYIRVPRLEHKEVMEKLKRKVSPFILRRMKKDVLSELPPVSETIYHCNLSDSQLDLYRSYAKSAKEELSKLVKKEGFDRVQIHVLATLTRLKQICCHPAIFAKEEAEVGDSAKYDMMMDLLQSLLKAKHKTVIFSQYTRMLHIIQNDLKSKGIPFSYLDGASKNRMGIVKEFNETEEIPVFLVSLKAGGSGLNLTGADTVIHYDMWWNPAVENQATDRVHRIGQKKSVSSYKLVTKGTIEEKIVDLQSRKTGLVKQVVSTDDEALSKLTWEEVLELLQT